MSFSSNAGFLLAESRPVRLSIAEPVSVQARHLFVKGPTSRSSTNSTDLLVLLRATACESRLPLDGTLRTTKSFAFVDSIAVVLSLDPMPTSMTLVTPHWGRPTSHPSPDRSDVFAKVVTSRTHESTEASCNSDGHKG